MDRETEKKIFDFKLFLQEDFLNQDVFNEKYFNKVSLIYTNCCLKLIMMFNCESVFLDDAMQIPDI